MTQIQGLTTTSLPSSSGKKAFRLRVYNKVGDRLLETYTSDNPGGILEGFVSRRYPSGVNGQCDFEAKPNLTAISEGAILYLDYDTGFSFIPVHMGVVTNSPDPRHGGRGVYEVSGGKELLKRSVIPADAPPYTEGESDVAEWLQYFVSFYKHPALKYSEDRIPFTGVMINAEAARGANLYEAIEAVLKAVPTIGENDWGVDPEGYVVIRPPTGEVALPYSFVEGQLKVGNIDSKGVVTKAIIRVANQVSEGAIVSAGYRPSLITYSYEHPLHMEWRAARSFDLPKNDEGKPVIDVTVASEAKGYRSTLDWTATGTTGETALGDAVKDENLATFVTSGSYAESWFFHHATTARPEDFIGVDVVIEAKPGSYDLELAVEFLDNYANILDARVVHSIKYNLNEIIGKGTSQVRLVATYPEGATPATVIDAQGKLYVRNASANSHTGLVKLYRLRSLEINKVLLDQIARAQIRLPAREVTQITCARGLTEGQVEGGFLLESLGKTITLTGAPEPITGPIAEVVDTFTTTEGMLSRVATGNPIRSPEVRAIEQLIRGY